MTGTQQQGRVHSIQSLGTLDGPGVRFVIFLQGCPLRCACCHNPDTWDTAGGRGYNARELVSKAVRYREYFGQEGGVTVSGGEPLLQVAFVRELFELCHKEGVNTCLDTSGCLLDESVKALLDVTDRVLLDLKYVSDEHYRAYVGCPIETPLRFLDYLNEKKIPTTLRQVIIPTLNDSPKDALAWKAIADAHSCVDKIELLPFRKLCTVKYEKMGIPFRCAQIPEPTRAQMEELNALMGTR